MGPAKIQSDKEVLEIAPALPGRESRVPMEENGGGDLAHFNLLLLAGAVLAWNAFAPLLCPAHPSPSQLTLTQPPQNPWTASTSPSAPSLDLSQAPSARGPVSALRWQAATPRRLSSTEVCSVLFLGSPVGLAAVGKPAGHSAS